MSCLLVIGCMQEIQPSKPRPALVQTMDKTQGCLPSLPPCRRFSFVYMSVLQQLAATQKKGLSFAVSVQSISRSLHFT